MVNRDNRERIRAFEERAVQRDREVAELSARLSRLADTVEAIRASLRRPSPPTRLRAPPARSVPAIEELRDEVWALKTRLGGLPPTPAGFASLIVADFPALFAEFGGKRFTLLWRGSRDGFRAWDFHDRCDGHAPTLTLIRDTGGTFSGASLRWSGNRELEASCTASRPIRV
jgi:hypothetical protein